MKEMLARHKGKLILFAGQTLFLWEPVLLLVSQWVIMLVVLHANRNKEQSPKVLNLVAWILPVLSLLLGVVGQLAQGGADSAYLITALFTFFMGLLFFLIGNYMPKTKQNGAVGIRIKWTLESEENWDATHRYAGKLWCLGGLLLMVCALIPSVLMVILLWIVILAAMVILPEVLSVMTTLTARAASMRSKAGASMVRVTMLPLPLSPLPKRTDGAAMQTK